MAPKFKDGDVVLAFPGSVVSYVHTVIAYGMARRVDDPIELRASRASANLSE